MEMLSTLEERDAHIATLEQALHAINAIRNSIIGAQNVNWSEHVYPLVAALEAAGFEGQPYPEAREYVGTMVERVMKVEAALRWRPAEPPPDDYAEVIAVNAAGEHFIATHFIAGGWAGYRVERSSPVVKWLPIPKE